MWLYSSPRAANELMQIDTLRGERIGVGGESFRPGSCMRSPARFPLKWNSPRRS